MLESISVGVDDSTTSVDALMWADHIAHATGARLRVLQAWEFERPSLLGQLFPSFPSDETLEAESRKALHQTVTESPLVGDPEQVLRQGQAGNVLVDESRTDDLLVLGRTGSEFRRLAQIVLGSTARYVINNANVAVAVVPEDARWVDAPKVFVGIDGSRSSCKALRWALTNLPESAEIHAVWALTYWSEALMAVDMELFHHASAAVQPELARCIKVATRENTSLTGRVMPRVEPGSPRRVFTNADAGMDLVIVGKHGASGTAAPIIGSVADHVVRYAPCPVIVVPT